jgi:hypothetical protein
MIVLRSHVIGQVHGCASVAQQHFSQWRMGLYRHFQDHFHTCSFRQRLLLVQHDDAIDHGAV